MSKDEAEKSFWITIITSVLFVIFGTYLLYKPNTTITIVARCLTILTSCVGVFGIYRYIVRKNKKKKIDFNLIYGIISFLIALILYFYPLIISGFVPLVIFAVMIANILLKLGFINQVRKNSSKDYGVCIMIMVLMIVLSVFILFDPLKTVLISNQSKGIIIIFYAILDTIISYLFKNNII